MIPWSHWSPQPIRHFDRFSHYCTDDCRVLPFSPIKIVPSHGRMLTPFNTFPWAHRTSTQMTSRSVSHFCKARYCDRPTEHATWSVAIGRIYVRCSAMRPNNSGIQWHFLDMLWKCLSLWLGAGSKMSTAFCTWMVTWVGQDSVPSWLDSYCCLYFHFMAILPGEVNLGQLVPIVFLFHLFWKRISED